MRQQRNPVAASATQPDASRELDRIKKKCSCGACEPPKPKLPSGTHRIKVQPKYVERAFGPNTFVPMILLKGEWLRKTGFDCQSYVIITEEPGKLVIRLEK